MDETKKDSVEAAPVAKEETRESKKPVVKKAEAPVPVPPIPAVPAPAEAAQFRVLEQQTIMWRGTLTRLSKGKILTETHWGGKVGIDNLKSQGVKLELVK